MKKVVVASLLSYSAVSATLAIGIFAGAGIAFAQTQVNLGSGQSTGVTMQPDEFKEYDDAVNKQTTPQTQAPALEKYLADYPQSAVKADVLQRLMIAYSQFDATKALDAADRLLKVDPNSLPALTIEVAIRKQAADAMTDVAAKTSALDVVAGFATKGLATTAPKDVPAADFAKQKANSTKYFYSALGDDALTKKDYPGAIAAFKSEIASVTPAETQTPGQVLQDIYYLGSAYFSSTPPDYIDCTWYASRAAYFAPEAYKPQLQPLATYCYKKYHGGADGYDVVTTAVATNVNPPADLKITPAPSNADIAKKTVAETPDLATLALSDKEFILQYGTPEDSAKVFDTIKGKTTEIPDATVISSTDNSIMVAVSDDAVQSKTADFTFNMTKVLTPQPVVGSKITLVGTYASYTQTPVMIVMSDGEIKKPAVKRPAPGHRPAPHK